MAFLSSNRLSLTNKNFERLVGFAKNKIAL